SGFRAGATRTCRSWHNMPAARSAPMLPRDRIRAAIERRRAAGEPALVAFLTAGYPRPDDFLAALEAISSEADAVEIGVPFSDPMADGVTIQRAKIGRASWRETV